MIEEQIESLRKSAKEQLQLNQRLEENYKKLIARNTQVEKDIEDKLADLALQQEQTDSLNKSAKNLKAKHQRELEQLQVKEEAVEKLSRDQGLAEASSKKKHAHQLSFLEKEAETLNEREIELNKRKLSLDDNRTKLNLRSDALDKRADEIRIRLNALDDEISEAANGNKQVKADKAELALRAAELDTKAKAVENDKLKNKKQLNELTKRENDIKDREEYLDEEGIRLQALWDKVDRKIEIHKLRGELNEQKTSPKG